MKLTSLKVLGLTILSMGLVAGGLASASERTSLSIANWASPQHVISTAGMTLMAEELEEVFDVQYYPGGALLSSRASLSGLSDGIADLALVVNGQYPAELPHAQLIADAGMLSSSPLAAALAASEFQVLHCSDCLEEFDRQNIVFLGGHSTSSYALISKTPISDLGDLEGLRIRAPGSLWSRWVQSVGAVDVNIPSAEMYEALDRGALDVAVHAPNALRGFSLWDAADNITLLNLGSYVAMTTVGVNKDTWQALSLEEREAIAEQAARRIVSLTAGYMREDDEVLEQAAERGINIITPSDALLTQRNEFSEADQAAMVDFARERHGIDDAEAKVALLAELAAKWEAHVESVSGDEEALTQLAQEEIYSKLDLSSFGN